ncbi:MAG: glycoside hydrolase family 2 [Actinomycetota bacterium]|nr:glycoside hydrolase family 2 [Actinomycetota bacterium]
MISPRAEHPRPRLRRAGWTSLNGPWSFAFDDEDRGLAQHWERAVPGEAPLDGRIIVPFCPQSELSGIADRGRHDVVWYARSFDDVRRDASQRLLLHFGAVDYRASVWVDGAQVATHEGGSTPFAVDITDAVMGSDRAAVTGGEHTAVTGGGHTVVVRAEDPLDDLEIPRGKQYWGTEPEGIFYTATTGIWQSVWLEPVAPERVVDLRLDPDLDAGAIVVEVSLTSAAVGTRLRLLVRLHDELLVDDTVAVTAKRLQRRLPLAPHAQRAGSGIGDWQGIQTWSPDQPTLYDLHCELTSAGGQPLDAVDSYFGMRKIEARGGRLYLNHRPFYPRLVLDQGYFPGGLLTAASDDDLRRDIELAIQLGFNGARKHQKIEDPRWLHWADRLGFVVWAEMPSSYRFSAEAVSRSTAEWQAVLRRDSSHPCIIAWVPCNESWGVPALGTEPAQRNHLLTLHHLTKSADPSRLVVSNDGWEQAATDLCTIHDYDAAAVLHGRYADLASALAAEPCGRPVYTTGFRHLGEPLLVTEFGGVAVDNEAATGGNPRTWGYQTAADGNDLLDRYTGLVAALTASQVVAGFCYTQLTDVEQEVNGLLTFDRKPKADPADLRRATQQGPS